jgi:hypothetical protein
VVQPALPLGRHRSDRMLSRLAKSASYRKPKRSVKAKFLPSELEKSEVPGPSKKTTGQLPKRPVSGPGIEKAYGAEFVGGFPWLP